MGTTRVESPGRYHRCLERWGLLGQADSSNPDSFSSLARSVRLQLFETLIDPLPKPVRILDLGGTTRSWERAGWGGRYDVHLTLLNAEREPKRYNHIDPLEGTTEDLSRFEDHEFDVVLCNSVIQHLGTLDRQEKMAREVIRVGKAYWIQTPCFGFPIEPHFLVPGWQWLPRTVRVGALRSVGCGRHGPVRDTEEARKAVEAVRFLSREELGRLFPNARIESEKMFAWRKSWIVTKGFAPCDPTSSALSTEGDSYRVLPRIKKTRSMRRTYEEYRAKRDAFLRRVRESPPPNFFWGVDWAPTQKCNVACSYCTFDHDGTPNEDLDRGVETILRIRPRFIWVGGGESSLIPGIASILRRIKEEADNPWIAFSTNFLSPFSVYEGIAEHVDALYASLDGVGGENRENRGYDGKRVLDRLVDFVPRHPKPHWSINTTVTVSNLPTLESFAREVQTRLPGISQSFWPMTPENHPRSVGRTEENSRIFEKAMRRIEAWHPHCRYALPARRLRHREGDGRDYHPLDRPPAKEDLGICHRQFFIADVMESGEVMGCPERQMKALDYMASSALRRGDEGDLRQTLELFEEQARQTDPPNPLCAHPCTCFGDISKVVGATSIEDPSLQTIPEFSGRFTASDRAGATAFIRENLNPAFREAFFDHIKGSDELKRGFLETRAEGREALHPS